MKFSLRLLALSGLLLSLLAAGPLRAQTGTISSGSIVSGGLTRQYIVYVPKAYQAGKAVPLLFNLHGLGQNNTAMLTYGDFRKIADSANFIIVLPNGVKDPSIIGHENDLGWNTWGTKSTVNDVGFISDLLTSLQSQYTIDANRVYSAGFSNGGFMSYELACQLNNRIAAVAAVAGGLVSSHFAACTPQHPTPVLDIHGTADSTVFYKGGITKPNHFSFVSIPNVLAYWAGFNGCAARPDSTMIPHNTANGKTTVQRFGWSGGRYDSKVVHYKVIGGDHSWPGAPYVSRDINASVEIWKFLRPLRLSHLQGLDPINLALNRPVQVSSSSATTLLGPNAVDGNASTRWSSAYSDKQWLYVDLGASYNVNRVKITWQAAYGKDFDVEVSNDASIWTLLQPVTSNTKLVNDLTGLSGTGRYVRINGKARGTQWGYSIFELEVYGPAATQQTLATKKVQAAQLTQAVDAGELILFPNPATATVALSGVATFPATADIYDAQGTRLRSLQLTQANDVLDVSKLTTGLYTIRVSSQQRVQAVRLQKN